MFHSMQTTRIFTKQFIQTKTQIVMKLRDRVLAKKQQAEKTFSHVAEQTNISLNRLIGQANIHLMVLPQAEQLTAIKIQDFHLKTSPTVVHMRGSIAVILILKRLDAYGNNFQLSNLFLSTYRLTQMSISKI